MTAWKKKSLSRNLQQTLTQNDVQESSNGGEALSGAITKDEALNTIRFYGNAYDVSARKLIRVLNNCGHIKSSNFRVDDVGNVIDEIQRYGYQYNVKIVGLPAIDLQESRHPPLRLYDWVFYKLQEGI